jgi:hypothetical protein
MSVVTTGLRARTVRNAWVDWSGLDANAYTAHHYRWLRADDREIIARTADFLAAHARPGGRAVDVGTGSNLYPALGLLPYAASVDLVERSGRAVRWLRRQCAGGFGAQWDPFIDAYRDNVAYADFYARHDARAELRARTTVRCESIFDLPRARWDLGTMFFTACSLSTSRGEFRRALRKFVGAIAPGGPFVAAFMTGSVGYQVRDRRFPAVPVQPRDIEEGLKDFASGVEVHPIFSPDPVRAGVGMAVATGFAG